MDQNISKEEMKRKTLEHAEKVIFNLQQAYKVRPPDITPEEEKELIDAMVKAKKLRDGIKEAFEKEEK